MLDRVEVGDAQRVRDQAAGRRAAPGPDGDALLLRPVDEVGDDQEVARRSPSSLMIVELVARARSSYSASSSLGLPAERAPARSGARRGPRRASRSSTSSSVSPGRRPGRPGTGSVCFSSKSQRLATSSVFAIASGTCGEGRAPSPSGPSRRAGRSRTSSAARRRRSCRSGCRAGPRARRRPRASGSGSRWCRPAAGRARAPARSARGCTCSCAGEVVVLDLDVEAAVEDARQLARRRSRARSRLAGHEAVRDLARAGSRESAISPPFSSRSSSLSTRGL